MMPSRFAPNLNRFKLKIVFNRFKSVWCVGQLRWTFPTQPSFGCLQFACLFEMMGPVSLRGPHFIHGPGRVCPVCPVWQGGSGARVGRAAAGRRLRRQGAGDGGARPAAPRRRGAGGLAAAERGRRQSAGGDGARAAGDGPTAAGCGRRRAGRGRRQSAGGGGGCVRQRSGAGGGDGGRGRRRGTGWKGTEMGPESDGDERREGRRRRSGNRNQRERGGRWRELWGGACGRPGNEDRAGEAAAGGCGRVRAAAGRVRRRWPHVRKEGCPGSKPWRSKH